MAQDHDQIPLKNTNLTTNSRWPLRRTRHSLRRRKLPTVRLGGEKPRRGMFLVRMLRRMRLRWLKLQYLCMLKKIKENYLTFMKDIKVSGASIDVYQQRLLMETSFAVPGLGITFSNFLSLQPGSNPSRSFIIITTMIKKLVTLNRSIHDQIDKPQGFVPT
ncbi:unnamed protein product, partial [Dovyalis caffra]